MKLTKFKEAIQDSFNDEERQELDLIIDKLRRSKLSEDKNEVFFHTCQLEDIVFHKALQLTENGKDDHAVRLFMELKDITSDNPNIYLNLTTLYMEGDGEQQAKKLMRRAKELYPENQFINDWYNELKPWRGIKETTLI